MNQSMFVPLVLPTDAQTNHHHFPNQPNAIVPLIPVTVEIIFGNSLIYLAAVAVILIFLALLIILAIIYCKHRPRTYSYHSFRKRNTSDDDNSSESGLCRTPQEI